MMSLNAWLRTVPPVLAGAVLSACIFSDSTQPIEVVNGCGMPVQVEWTTVLDSDDLIVDVAGFVEASAAYDDSPVTIEPGQSARVGELVNGRGTHVILVLGSEFVESQRSADLEAAGWTRRLPPEACP